MTGIYPPLPEHALSLPDGSRVYSGDEVTLRVIARPDGGISRGVVAVRPPLLMAIDKRLKFGDWYLAYELCGLAAVHRRGWYFHHYTGEKEQ